MKRLQQFLVSHPVIGLDSAVFIYHLEDHPRYAPLTEIIFTALEKGANRGVTSYLPPLLHSATGFLTNDRVFERIKDIDILILDKSLT